MRSLIIAVMLAVQLSGCSSLMPGFETPTVTITSFKVVPGTNSIVPTFEIGLHVVNPNRTSLKLQGLSYHVELEGYRILSGVANQLPVIAAYGEGDIVLRADPDLMNALDLFTDLMEQPREKFKFKLEALLDMGGLMSRIHVEKEGEISLIGVER